MDDYSAHDLAEAVGPIASLLSKSEKAQQKLALGTWQHTMLENNIRALRIAHALMTREADGSAPAETGFEREDLQPALEALLSMIARTENVRTKFAPGTSQHTLQRNRLKALRIAEALVRAELDKTL